MGFSWQLACLGMDEGQEVSGVTVAGPYGVGGRVGEGGARTLEGGRGAAVMCWDSSLNKGNASQLLRRTVFIAGRSKSLLVAV